MIRDPCSKRNSSHLSRVATMDEEKLRRSILGIFRGLFHANLREIPHVDTPVE